METHTKEIRESLSIIFKQFLRIYKALPHEVIVFILLTLIRGFRHPNAY